MKKQGAASIFHVLEWASFEALFTHPAHNKQLHRLSAQIILGIGGDNSDKSKGSFFEGVICSGYTTNATDDAVMENIVAARYSL